MKPLPSLLRAAALSLCCFSTSHAAPSKITAVTVYADRAMVTRTATLDLAAGPAEVLFEKLPAALVEQSLTVNGRGTAQVTILDVVTRATHVDVSPNERLRALEAELRGWSEQRRALEDRGEVLKAQAASLDRLEAAATAPPTKESAPRLSLDESTQLLRFLEEQRTKLHTENRARDAQAAELAAKQAATERQMALIRRDGGVPSYKSVVVRLDATTAGQVELAVSYSVPGAKWTPRYDVRARSNEADLELTYFGQVQQNTGEDWKDVALTLSTARPSLGGGAPEAGNWVVDVWYPPMATAGSTAVMTSTTAAAMAPGTTVGGWGGAPAPVFRVGGSRNRPEDVAATLDRFEVSSAQASVESAATSASFKLAAPATILSDNAPQKVPVTSAVFNATPEYLATPKRVAAAFLTAKVVNSSDFPLLAGPMNVFLDGTFVTTSELRAVMPGEKFDLALGADEGISVKHKRVQRFAEDTGLTSRGRRITYEYVMTIQNNKRTAAHVVVADHVPVSRNEKVVVRVIAPGEKDQKPATDGAIKWTLDLKPGEKRELTLKFSIDHPGDVRVTGLES